MANIKHFEDLWEEAEKLSSEIHKAESKSDILKLVDKLIFDYINLDSDVSIPMEVKKSLKSTYLGEILFCISAISSIDNINVYGSLLQEVKLNENI